MNNEPNKPTELTEKELEDIAGGARGLVIEVSTMKDVAEVESGKVERVAVEGGGSFVRVSPADGQFLKVRG